MNYKEFYTKINRPDLVAKIELIRATQKKTEVEAADHEVLKIALQTIDYIVGLYLDNLIGTSKDPQRLYEAVLKYIEVDNPSAWMSLFYQRLHTLHQSLIEFELYEIAQKMGILNDSLSGWILAKNRNVDTTPLTKLENLGNWREGLHLHKI